MAQAIYLQKEEVGVLTVEEIRDFEHRLTEVEERSKSYTKRLNEHSEAIKENNAVITAIEKIATEMKFMREDLNKTIERLDKIEGDGNNKWEKFKWILVTAAVGIILGYLAAAVGLK